MCPGPLTYDEDGNIDKVTFVKYSNRTEFAKGSTSDTVSRNREHVCSLPLAVILAMFWLYHELGELSLPCS